jgi:hypothetical protein
MIPTPMGWRICDGEADLTLVPADGSRGGSIRYHERLRPLRSLDEVVRGLVGSASATSQSRPFTTGEGEQGTIVVVGQRTIAYLPVDDFYALTIGTAVAPSVIEALARRDRHHLTTRLRPLALEAPAGWAARTRGRIRSFHAPDGELELVAPPAEAVTAPGAFDAVLATHLGALPGARVLAAGPLDRAGAQARIHELRCARADGTAHVRYLATLRDARYLYSLFLDAPASRAGEARRLLEQAARTVRLVFPRPATPAGSFADAVGHWIQ